MSDNPLEDARALADEKGLEGEDREDFILAKMQRAGFKKGPGEWIRPEDDDSPQDDDDEPITRGEWRKIQRERAKEKANLTPPKREGEPDTRKPLKKRNDSGNAWWR